MVNDEIPAPPTVGATTDAERLVGMCGTQIAVLLEEAGRLRQYGDPNYSRLYTDAHAEELERAAADWRTIASIVRASLAETAASATGEREDRCRGCGAGVDRPWGHLVSGLCLDCRDTRSNPGHEVTGGKHCWHPSQYNGRDDCCLCDASRAALSRLAEPMPESGGGE